jgi:hypothetical protein
MKRMSVFAATLICVLGAFFVFAQQQQGGRGGGQQAPQQPMSFFITSAGPGNGANLGGLAGADAWCQRLAQAAGSTKTFRAYLSTQGQGAVNARDRIGTGPWFNARGQRIAADVADLHGDTLEQARVGNNLKRNTALDEKGAEISGVAIPGTQNAPPNRHDMLTGSTPDGRAYTDNNHHTCSNWTSSADGMGSAQLGHHDRTGGQNLSWNSAHGSRGCSQANLVATGGAGLFYCFAIN